MKIQGIVAFILVAAAFLWLCRAIVKRFEKEDRG
jgi:hypothetical protein